MTCVRIERGIVGARAWSGAAGCASARPGSVSQI